MTQATDVKPLITVACYLDDQMGMEVYQEVTGESWPACSLMRHHVADDSSAPGVSHPWVTARLRRASVAGQEWLCRCRASATDGNQTMESLPQPSCLGLTATGP